MQASRIAKSKLFIIFFAALFVAPAFAATPLYVVIGGFHSCRETDTGDSTPFSGKLWRAFYSNLYTPMQDQVGVRPMVVAGCFTEVLGLSPKLEFRLSSDDNPTAQVITIAGLLKAPTAESMAPVVEALRVRIQERLQKSPNSAVYFVGHSYGAWVAMRTSLSLLDQGQKIQTLYTLDPISPLNCNPLRFVQSMMYTVAGCQEAPSDISSGDRIRLRDQTGGWRNFYQTQFHRLHSGVIPELDELHQSYKIRVASPNALYNDQHVTLAEDPKVWSFIGKMALRDAQLTRE